MKWAAIFNDQRKTFLNIGQILVPLFRQKSNGSSLTAIPEVESRCQFFQDIHTETSEFEFTISTFVYYNKRLHLKLQNNIH